MVSEKDYVKKVVGTAIGKERKNYADTTVSKVLKGASTTTCKPCEKVAKKYT